MRFGAIKQGSKLIVVNIDQVEWIEPLAEHSTRIHFASGKEIVVDESTVDTIKKFSEPTDD